MRIAILLPALVAVPIAALAQDAAMPAFEAAMQSMMSGMHTAPSGDPDKDFARMMKPRHQGAIDMAKVELQFGDDPELRAMAEEIIAAQTAEIATLDAWLAKHQ